MNRPPISYSRTAPANSRLLTIKVWDATPRAEVKP